MRRVAGLLAGTAVAVVATAAAALSDGRDEAVFDLVVLGLPAGQLTVAASVNEGGYAAAARLRSSGVAALVRRLRFDASVQGYVEAGRLVPARYSEDVNTGRRESRTVMEYTRGVPRVISMEPEREPRPHHLDPATQGGTLDPMTALFRVLRDVPPAEACRLTLDLFDGRRRAQVAMVERRERGDEVICAGEFRRIAGYSERELSEARRFPFRMHYRDNGDGMLRMVRLDAESQMGSARLMRR